MRIKVASNNPTKIEAIRNGFERYFANVQIEAFEVNSNVPSQPINEEVFKGAENRIQEIKYKGDLSEWDFLVSSEGGLLNQYGHWFNVQVIQIESKDGKTGIGLSQGFQIPDEYVEEAKSTSVAKLLDRLFLGKGGIRLLTSGCFNRTKLIEDGTIMALTRVMNGDVW